MNKMVYKMEINPLENRIKYENYLEKKLQLDPYISRYIFKHPKESRFQLLFLELKPKNKKKKSKIVHPRNIMLNSDKRTSIIIKNIPDNYTSKEFKEIIFNYCKYIDFFYIPSSVKTRKNLRVAFINVLDYKDIVPIYIGLLFKNDFFPNEPNIKIEICYSNVQGRVELIKRFLPELQNTK